MVNFVVLCGGSGSRLWPKSREKLPKQLLPLINDLTMLQNTVQRILYLESNPLFQCLDNRLTIICNQDHSHMVENQLKELDFTMEYQIISEPKGRDSAPAICIAALLGSNDDYTFVLPCDHVLDEKEFAKCCVQSIPYLQTESIVTFGIQPTHPETGYGYIKINEKNETLQFIEKPNAEKAQEYLKQGTYLWNAGIFAFKNSSMLQCFLHYASDILHQCKTTMANSSFQNRTIPLDETSFSKCRAISVDYAIMENLCKDSTSKIKKITLPYYSYWNDIGSYLALYEQLEKDENQNVLKGDILTLETKNCYIDSEKAMVAAIGLENLIIVNTDDALLICNGKKTQDVKKIVEYLKKEKREECVLHKKVFRPWGYYINVEGKHTDGFKIKRIAVYPGKRLSLQSHQYRSEHWVIVKGNAKVRVGNKEFILEKDQSVYIPVEALHRIENIGDELLEFTETQIGEYLGEDDIIRYEDDFGRK